MLSLDSLILPHTSLRHRILVIYSQDITFVSIQDRPAIDSYAEFHTGITIPYRRCTVMQVGLTVVRDFEVLTLTVSVSYGHTSLYTIQTIPLQFRHTLA